MNNHAQAQAKKIMATHCVFCGRELNDSESVQRGIGPICNKNYNQAIITPQATDVAKALGVLAANGSFVATIDNTLMPRLLERHPDGHKIGNLLIYEASTYLKEKQFVLILSQALRMLGYTVAADKIQKDRSPVKLVPADGQFEVYTPFSKPLNNDIFHVPGIRSIREHGQFKCRTIPTTSLPDLMVVLGKHFPNEGAWIEGAGTTVLKAPTQAQLDSLIREAKSEIKLVEACGNVFEVHAPFNRAFTDGLKGIRGRRAVFDPTTDKFQHWTVPMSKKSTVVDLVNKHYSNPEITIVLQTEEALPPEAGLEWIGVKT